MPTRRSSRLTRKRLGDGWALGYGRGMSDEQVSIELTKKELAYVVAALRAKAAADRQLVGMVGNHQTEPLNAFIRAQADNMDALADRLEAR